MKASKHSLKRRKHLLYLFLQNTSLMRRLYSRFKLFIMIFKVIIEDLWFYRRYFEESTLKVEKIINDHDMKLILKSSITFIYNKSMKKEDYFKNEVNESKN